MTFNVKNETSGRRIKQYTTEDLQLALTTSSVYNFTYKKKAAIKACTAPDTAMSAAPICRRPAAEKKAKSQSMGEMNN